MKSAEKILIEYKNNGLISETEEKQIMEKCAQLYKEAGFWQDIKESANRVKSGINAKMKESLEGASPIMKQVGKPGIAERVKAVLKSDAMKPFLIGKGVALAISGGIGAAAIVGHKLSDRKNINANYSNLASKNPNLIKGKEVESKRLVAELTSLSPMAAANDNMLRNYVKKGLEGKLDIKHLAEAALAQKPSRRGILDYIRYPGAFANIAGEVASVATNMPGEDAQWMNLSREDKNNAILSHVVSEKDEVSRTQMQSLIEQGLKDPNFEKKVLTDPSITPTMKEAIIQVSLAVKGEKMEKKSSLKEVTVEGVKYIQKQKPFAEAVKHVLPFFGIAAGAGVGIGAAGAALQAMRTKKEFKEMEETLKRIKKNSDYKGKEKQVDQAFDILVKFAPSLATQPQTALPFIRQAILDYPDRITGEPMIGPEQIQTLVKLQKEYESRDLRSPIVSGFHKGFEVGYRGARETAQATKTLPYD